MLTIVSVYILYQLLKTPYKLICNKLKVEPMIEQGKFHKWKRNRIVIHMTAVLCFMFVTYLDDYGMLTELGVFSFIVLSSLLFALSIYNNRRYFRSSFVIDRFQEG